ncbi:membrane protein required for colicin V production [Methylopila capsulata]|uniref:Colicin V biosynthesis protein n=1 Tax=Methylopila capsulata TaxID=61654 RepID=A0A9W6IRV6_9HYPH|nr:CvpA family protein [Methylopila capsulata]MBM7850062.1 membrane protein required for colicin V production [Methylopila capsulata]GLK55353.1 colicin V biosynthesis protein [Methylopila capsulata]
MTITLLDVVLIAVMLISAGLAMVRGVTREVLAIASWVAATAATIYFFEPARTLAREHIKFNPPQIADVVAAGGIFVVTLLVVSFITMKISDAILDSRIGPLDRTLGFVFGAARGLLLVVIAFLFFTWLVPEKGQPEWFRTAGSKPILQSAGDQLLALLPDDPESTILQKLKRRDGEGGDAANPAAPATPDSAPPADDGPAGPSTQDRQGLQNLLDRNGRPSQ